MFNKIADTFNKLKTGGKGSVIVIIIAVAFMVTPPLIWTVTQVSGQFCEQDVITRDGPVLETQDQVAVIGGDFKLVRTSRGGGRHGHIDLGF